MWKHFSPLWLLIAWLLVVAVIVCGSVVLDAKLATSAFLLVLGVMPAIITLLIGVGGPSPTVAEILHSVHTADGRK